MACKVKKLGYFVSDCGDPYRVWMAVLFEAIRRFRELGERVSSGLVDEFVTLESDHCRSFSTG